MNNKKHLKLHVTSEIGRLKTVLLHRPGDELKNLVPDHLERLLFDDIPYLDFAKKEHDEFAKILRDNGTEVLYLEDLAAESIINQEIRDRLISEFLDECNIFAETLRDSVKEYFADMSNKKLILTMMSGIRKTDIPGYGKNFPILDEGYPFIADAMPNLYFTRDPFAVVGNGVTLHRMRTVTRNRESIFGKYIFKYHPSFDGNVPIWYNRTEQYSLEGGDVLVLGKKNLAIGISQRTDAEAILRLAKNILFRDDSFDRIIALCIPRKRAFMHLDTVFTMIDVNKFTIHPEIEGTLRVYTIEKNPDKKGKLLVTEEESELKDILKKYLSLDDVELIRCAGGDPIDAPREQWNDGSNTLAIAPGEVLVYDRNIVTNRILKENGIKIHEMTSAELSRGRGGPRCMSMPFVREDII